MTSEMYEKQRTCFECGREIFKEDCYRHYLDLEDIEYTEFVTKWWSKDKYTPEFNKIWESEHVEFYCCQCYQDYFGKNPEVLE